MLNTDFHIGIPALHPFSDKINVTNSISVTIPAETTREIIPKSVTSFAYKAILTIRTATAVIITNIFIVSFFILAFLLQFKT